MVAGCMGGCRSAGKALAMSRDVRMYVMMMAIVLPLSALWKGFAFPPHAPASFPVHFYQHVIAHLDGRECPSFPVCSAYAREAISTHGVLLGSWLALDRLIHEAGDLHRGPWIIVAGRQRLYDPLSRNDPWLTSRRQ